MKSKTPSTALEPMFSRRFLYSLIIPLVIEQFLAVSIGIADTVMVASAGEAAVSAISLVDAITILIVQLFAAFATGGAVVSAQYLGKKDYPSANIAAKQLLILSLFVSSLLLVFCLPIRRQVIRLIFGSIETTVLDYGTTYFMYILLSLPFLAAYNAVAALFRSMGNSKVSLWVSVVMNVVNVVGNAYFILVLKLGVVGAGLATLLSRIIGSIIILFLIANRDNTICIRNYRHLSVQWNMVKRILTVGIPNGIEGSVFQIGKLLVQGFIAAFGTPSIAANAIAGAVSSFANIPGGAIGLASITIVGQAVGAKKPEQAIYYAKKLLLLAYISMFIVALPLFLFASSLVLIFNLSAEASLLGANVIRTAMVFGALFWPTAFALPNFLRAAGDAKYTMLISMLSMWIFRVGASYILAVVYNMGIYGVWLGMYLDWIVRSACFVFRFARGKWKTKRVI